MIHLGTDGVIAYAEVNPDYTQAPGSFRAAGGARPAARQQGRLISS
jgi:hypothetical protein